jgi:hypothetical protein
MEIRRNQMDSKTKCVKNTTRDGKIAMLFVGGPLDGTWKYIKKSERFHAVDVREQEPVWYSSWATPAPSANYHRVIYVRSVVYSPHNDDTYYEMNFMRPKDMSDAEALWKLFEHYSTRKEIPS